MKNPFKFNKQCLFCRYKYDSNACFDAMFNKGYKCPSLSNIFYGKVIKIPVFKQLYDAYDDIMYQRSVEKWEEDYINDYETKDMKFIWGIKSYDDLCNSPACLGTMNDIDLIYLKDEDKYILGIETIYHFESEDAKYDYMKELLDKFTEFMLEYEYDINYEFEVYQVFTYDISINKHFKSIEEAYATFKLFVNGFCSLSQTNYN